MIEFVKRHKWVIATVGLVWVGFFFFPHLVSCLPTSMINEDSAITFEDLSMAYGAAGALFTALAFGLAFFSLYSQQKDLSDKTTLDVFMGAFNSLRNDPQFIKSRQYVFSKHFIDDVNSLKNSTSADIAFESFLRSSNTSNLTATQKKRMPYDSLIYFCDQMEYLGVLVTHKYFDRTILDYFGPTIIGSYSKLSEIIEGSRKRRSDNSLYIHFTKLYDFAEKRKDTYIMECKRYLEDRSQQ